MIRRILQPTTPVSNKFNNPTQILDSRRTSRNCKPILKFHDKTHRHQIPIFKAISQLVEKMNRMNSCVDKIQDFVKTNVPLTIDNKKGKQVSFSDQLPSQATVNARNQGASLNQMHNLNHAHFDKEVVETTLAISSLQSGKDLLDPYKDHPFHQGTIDGEIPIPVADNMHI